MFYIGTPLDTRMFNNDIIYILISESTQEAEVYMNKNQFLGKRNFTEDPESLENLLKLYLETCKY